MQSTNEYTHLQLTLKHSGWVHHPQSVNEIASCCGLGCECSIVVVVIIFICGWMVLLRHFSRLDLGSAALVSFICMYRIVCKDTPPLFHLLKLHIPNSRISCHGNKVGKLFPAVFTCEAPMLAWHSVTLMEVWLKSYVILSFLSLFSPSFFYFNGPVC